MTLASGRGSWTFTRGTPQLWAVVAASGLLLAILFWDALSELIKAWSREEYSHGFLIPFISLFLVWQKRDELAQMEFRGSWLGLGLLVLGLLLGVLGELATLFVVVQYAFLIMLYGIVLALVGWEVTKKLWAPLVFLFFMIPLPNFIYNNLSAELQLISSQIGVWVIRLFGISVFLEGNVIDLGTFKLQVVEACSGLRYLFPLMSLGFICAYFYKVAFWKRALVFLSTIPITILMNSFRIGVIGMLVEYKGIEMAEGFLHDFEGWVIFMASLGVLLAEMWLLARLGRDHRPLRQVFGVDLPAPLAKDAVRPVRTVSKPLLAVLPLLLVASVGSAAIGDRAEVIPAREEFATFPLTLGDWVGREDHLEQIYLDALKLDDYIMANYVNGNDRPLNFYVAYYASQRKGQSAHSPRSCIPGGGWRISSLTQRTVDGAVVGGQPLHVNRVKIEKGDYKQLVYYWFQERGRVITNEYLVKWYLFWDALTRNRTDGALVRLTLMLEPGEPESRADALLSDFAVSVVDELEPYIPGA